jgi:type IV secretion system protein VirB1
LPGVELMACQGLAVPTQVMHHVVRVESSFNPYAIGVVGGRLARQPKNLPEALSTVRLLESRGYNFSLGLAQVNRYNLKKYGLDSYERAFEPCANLVAGSQILAECYRRSSADWGKSFSCYYSGNFTTGFRHGYVQKIYASMRQGRDVEVMPSIAAIEVVARQARRTVPVSRYPLYTDNGASTASANFATSAIVTSASVPAEKPAALSRVQRIPTRVVVDSPVAAVESQSYIQPLPPSVTVQSATTQYAASNPAAVQAEALRNQVVTSPVVPVVSQDSAQVSSAKEPASIAPRARSRRDPALVGGQAPEQDSAFVF